MYRVVACFALALAPALQSQTISLSPCTIRGVEREVRCGVHQVFENRDAKSGRTIPIFVAVLPALESPAAPDPLFFLAGGPGQAATDLAGFASTAFAGVGRNRDIVLVDLPGTGRSGALSCRMFPTARDVAGDFYPIPQIRACRDSLSRGHDLKRYVTATLMDDLDEVRAALGYPRINIYGTSYGTRAALEYLRRHGDHVRTMALKAVVPPAMRGTMGYAQDTERSLHALFQACSSDPACSGAYPDLEAEFLEVLRRADQGALRGSVPDPAGGGTVELPLSRGLVASTILGLLQNSNSAVLLPLMVHRTFRGDTALLVEAIASYRRGLDAGIGFGMHLSVMCEDADRLNLAEAARNDRGTALGDYRVAQLVAACRTWGPIPRRTSTEPVRSAVPVLLVSGTLDP